MPTNFPDEADSFQALTPGSGGSRRDTPVGGRTNTGYLNDLGDAVEAIEGYLLETGPAAAGEIDAIRQGATDYGDRKLFGWRRALSLRDAGKATVLVVGDSRPEGCGVTLAARWQNLLLDQLRAAHPTAGDDQGRGYLATMYGCTNLVEPTRAGTVTEITVAGGPGFRGLVLSSTGPGTVTFDVHGTDALLVYALFPLAGKTEYRIDGGSWVEVDHAWGGGGFEYHQGSTLISLGASDDHTIDWRWKAQGTGIGPTPVIHGVVEYDGDPEIGIEVIDAAHGGWTAATFSDQPAHVTDWVELFDPDIVLVDIGTNDWNGTDHDLDDIPAAVAAYRDNLTQIVDAVRDGNADCEIVFLGGWTPRSSLTGDAAPEDWTLFVDAQYAVAAADRWVSVFDMRRFLPEPSPIADDTGGDTPGLTGGFYDSLAIHPEEQGHAAIASALAELLSLPVGGAYGEGPAVRSSDVFSIVTILQADYDLLDPPLPGVLYVIVDA